MGLEYDNNSIDLLQIETSTMSVHLPDFGLAKVITSTGSIGSKVGVVGTPGFQSPEVLKADGVDAKADVYSLGCVLVEMFEEKRLWHDYTPIQIMFKVGVESQLPKYDHLPEFVKKLCAMCLVPHDNRATSKQLLKALIETYANLKA